MRKLLSLLAVVLTLGLTTMAFDAEAKRLGSGGSSGMQRQSTPSQPAAAPSRQQQAAPATPPASGGSKWMGPIAGLAAGLGIAALASYLGFGEELANMLMIGLLIMAVLAVVGFVMRKRAMQQQQGGGLAYAGANAGAGMPTPAARPLQGPTAFQASPSAPAAGGSMIGSAIGAGVGASTPTAATLPAGFDAAAFTRQAKVQFYRLQAANDAGNLDDIREFTTPEMFAELRMDIVDRGAGAQQTDVVELEAEVLEVVEEAHRYIVSVRFSGMIREQRDAQAEAFNEVWHLTKPVSGQGGWVLAGIQQAQ